MSPKASRFFPLDLGVGFRVGRFSNDFVAKVPSKHVGPRLHVGDVHARMLQPRFA